jgi:hypothetical protein
MAAGYVIVASILVPAGVPAPAGPRFCGRAIANVKNRTSDSRTRSERVYSRERNPSQAMTRLLAVAPPPLAPIGLACGTQLSHRFTRATRYGYAPGMPGHLVGTYYGDARHCAWTVEGQRLSAPCLADRTAHDGCAAVACRSAYLDQRNCTGGWLCDALGFFGDLPQNRWRHAGWLPALLIT